MIPSEYYYLYFGKAADVKDPKERRLYRFFEMIPGLLAWGTLVFVFVLAWLTPVFIAFFVIAFDIYWLLKTIFLSLHLKSAFKKVRDNMEVDWLARLGSDKPGGGENYHLIFLPPYKEGGGGVGASLRRLAGAPDPAGKR